MARLTIQPFYPGQKLACTGCYFEPITDWHIERLTEYVRTPWPIDPLDTIHFNMERGPSGALYYNGKLLGIIGVAVLWKGVGEVWTIIDDSVKHKFKRQLIVGVRTALDIAQISMCLTRVQKQAVPVHRVQEGTLQGID